MSGPAAVVNQRDLQGNILCGYGHPCALFCFVRVANPEAGRRFLGSLLPDLTNALSWGTDTRPETLNVAFTHDGLRAIGVPEDLLQTCPEEFRQGMAGRGERLGDQLDTPPDQWDAGLRPGEPHMLVTVYGRDEAAYAEARRRLLDRIGAGAPAVHAVHELPTRLIETGSGYAREHFGFADGLAQPSIDDLKAGPTTRRGQGIPVRIGRERRAAWKDLAPGEFVLGYTDEDGVIPPAPGEPLHRNGSFMVVRKLHQDVALFRRAMREAAGGDEQRAELYAAKVIGRWRDGTPLALSPDRPNEALANDPMRFNDFRYGDDPRGLACPVGSHIRRANPRDALGWDGELSRRHRIIRRGMPYGDPLADEADLEDAAAERGLMFVCCQASIARQFELIQGSWLADGDACGIGEEKDFLMAPENGHGKMTIPGEPPEFLSPTRAFVTLRGGGYFFAPGIAALDAIAEGL